MFETFLRDMTMLVAQVHATLMHLNDSFELRLDDKALHFIVMAVLGFAIEIGQRITGTGSMDFGDVVAGLYGVLAFFGVYAVVRLLGLLVSLMTARRGKR